MREVHPGARSSRSLAWIVAAFLCACSDAPDQPDGGGGTREAAATAPLEIVDGGGPAGLDGRWRPHRPDRPEREGLPPTLEELEQTSYLTGSTSAPDESGVAIHERERTAPGLNLYVSGHAPEALLVDAGGRVLHAWRCAFERAFPAFPKERLEDAKAHWRQYFRRCALLPDGHLLAVFEGHGLVKLDPGSRVVWAFGGNAHHDLQLDGDGRIYVLTRTAHTLERIDPEHPVLEDFVSVLDADGNELRRVSILECFENSDESDARASLRRMKRFGDLLHTNTLELLDGSLATDIPAFRAGNVLVSCLKTDTIAVIDLDAAKVVWSRTGPWRRQHQPTVLANGRLLLFDNLGGSGPLGRSRVLEFDPRSATWPPAFAWTLESGAGLALESETCGSAQRLPNGNTLVTESDNGRAFEVTPDKEIVWEFVNPHRAGPRHTLIATLFELVRLPADQPLDWLAGG